jgi:hypothetical protein
MADLEFKTSRKRKDPLTFTVEGEDHIYSFTPPKTALMMLPMLDVIVAQGVGTEEAQGEAGLRMMKAQLDWLSAGLSEQDNDRLLARISDPEDDLDFETLVGEYIPELAKVTGGRPTTSRDD